MPFGPKPVPENRVVRVARRLAARLFIMIAGVTMNILLAFVVLTVLALAYGEPVIATRVVGRGASAGERARAGASSRRATRSSP